MERSSSTERFQPITSQNSNVGVEVTSDLYCYTVQIVNVIFYGKPGDEEWVLIDAGMPKSSEKIMEAAAARFGPGRPPKAIILTHAHFDHVGALIDLLEEWKDVPVYAHESEYAFITGQQDYPKPDASVEGGMVAKMSFMFPGESINIGDRAHVLPTDHSIPYMPGWKWVHTPGHTAGHISLFRETDHALIAGDAFVTVKQDALYKVITQELEMNGPPRYLTPDWESTELSVKNLAALQPELAITGHGVPVTDMTWLQTNLRQLTSDFKELAVPDHGKFVEE
ncbi:MBL fold metallo-hydrolase [Sporosarcina aquimarina]|uniref:MBL fold metallo-hydrolase n=1 Tax=Sporosarcina aquimarina TaxID=114975 RepID=A0ABU4G068_9BACL|nr:MBL fold metallo-hydrolase [Sporosarcina aquimarina]MDW0109765.1 MBL fold metallo-hydrolase [Sporosarcina aquimarina]